MVVAWVGNEPTQDSYLNVIDTVVHALSEPFPCYVHFTCPSKDLRPKLPFLEPIDDISNMHV